MDIRRVLISERCINFLQKRQLSVQYKKAKKNILKGNLITVDFKKRHPYKTEKYYFKINRQFRAICIFSDKKTINIFEIDDHQ
jgi:plasmid maintenance system killer protein